MHYKNEKQKIFKFLIWGVFRRNEKLQEKMKDCLIETYSNCSGN